MEDFKHQFGSLFSIPDVRDYIAHSNVSNDAIPKEFMLSNLPAIKNQGSVGSCVAHSLATVAEFYTKKETGKKTVMSTGYIYGNRIFTTHRGSGMYTREALKTMTKYGDVPHEYFPYNVEVPKAIELFEEKVDDIEEIGYGYKFKAYYKLTTEKDIKTHLLSENPVVIAMPWYDDIRIVNGVMITDQVKSKTTGGHCMVIVGWNETGWVVQNSWGSNWGNKGRFTLPYNIAVREYWGTVDAEPDDTVTIEKPFSTRFGRVIANIINKIISLFYKLSHKNEIA